MVKEKENGRRAHLPSLVPRSNDEEESRRDGRLQNSLETSHYEETLEVMASRNASNAAKGGRSSVCGRSSCGTYTHIIPQPSMKLAIVLPSGNRCMMKFEGNSEKRSGNDDGTRRSERKVERDGEEGFQTHR